MRVALEDWAEGRRGPEAAPTTAAHDRSADPIPAPLLPTLPAPPSPAVPACPIGLLSRPLSSRPLPSRPLPPPPPRPHLLPPPGPRRHSRSPLGSISQCLVQAYSTPSSCSRDSLPPATTSAGSESHSG